MLKSEMQHQFWITKKAVQRKFGSKEDQHIISSDAELDSKIELFNSITGTTTDLYKIIDNYQERLCVLSQEETAFGRFLKEAGKRSKTTSETVTSAGKAVSYCGQQRMCVRVPLLRLQHEVDVFRSQAITDMWNTITVMEKGRTEYRAALEWMKSASAELDPDTGRGLEKFRTAQSHVRNAKQQFDGLAMDTIQKIDLLAAARCNMFSHVLASYTSELKQFAHKTNTTFEAISKVMEQKPKYDFCILKELTQHEGKHGNVHHFKTSSLDDDQSLFFAEDYVDDESKSEEAISKEFSSVLTSDNLVQVCNNSEDIVDSDDKNRNESVDGDGLTKESNCAELLSKMLNTEASVSPELMSVLPIHSNTEQAIENEATLGLSKDNTSEKVKATKNLKRNSWLELFADLDPLSNLEAFDLKLHGTSKNFQQT